MSEATSKVSDLGVRAVSAVVMIVVAAGAFVLGGIWLDTFVIVVALTAFVEFVALILKVNPKPHYRLAAVAAGAGYVGFSAKTLIDISADNVFLIVGTVVAVDISAYFAGRKFGGPKIAPSISPSKTWAGLIGGAVGASAFLVMYSQIYATPLCRWYYDSIDSFDPARQANLPMFDDRCHIWTPPLDFYLLWTGLLTGLVFAVAAQAGDFFESWMKRRAGVKDSSNLIPGHGGVFDRTDGIIGAAFVFGIIGAILR
jgi:phosphatidate cytidylyltransferase